MSHVNLNPTLDPRTTAQPLSNPLALVRDQAAASNPADLQFEDHRNEYEALELWASRFDISDLELTPPPHTENEKPASLVPPPAPHNARALKRAAAKKRRHNAVKGDASDEYFWWRYDLDHVINWGR
jgi:hypothetical protein